ncbi:MAG: hypothetical protein AAF567_15155 [Actinomycetota bacterium]
MGRVNHRGWIVLESIPSDDHLLCVDFFEDPIGGFGFEHLRADPEDGGRWTAVGGHGTTRYDTPGVAADAAFESIAWLRSHRGARAAFEHWTAALQQGRDR